MTKNTVAIVPAAGRGVRMGKEKPKQFLEICGRPILAYTLDVLFSVHFLSGIFLVVPQDFLRQAEELVGNCRTGGTGAFSRSGRRGDVAGISSYMPQAQGCTQRKDADFFIRVVAGGAERQESVLNALRVLPADCDWVLIHDGVRPFASAGLMEETWKAAQSTGAAIAALPATDTVKRVNRQRVIETLPREQIWLVQTPQVFRKDVILSAYGEARAHGWSGTDDASLVERLDVPVSVVRGECSNIKVTAPEDLGWAAWFLNRHFDGAYGE